jgi:serine/threonine protein kinase
MSTDYYKIINDLKPGDNFLSDPRYEVLPITHCCVNTKNQRHYHEGAYGYIFKVFHRIWRQELAAKILKPDYCNYGEEKERFIKECEIWTMNDNHENVATCHYVYVPEIIKMPVVFSDYTNEGTLKDWIETKKIFGAMNGLSPLVRILDFAIQFARGLSFFHERDKRHGDVKPSNALIWEDETLKVSDFGLSIAVDDFVKVVPSATEEYQPPEIILQKSNLIGFHSDIFSWAACILQMLAGNRIWDDSLQINKKLDEFIKKQPPNEYISEIPDALVALLRRCFIEKPGDRPVTIQHCINDLIALYKVITGSSYPRPERAFDEDGPEILNNRALSLFDLGRTDKAFELFERAMNKSSMANLSAVYNRGLLLTRRVKGTSPDHGYCDLLEKLLSLRELNPHDAMVECALGHLFNEVGCFEQAYKHYIKAVEVGTYGDFILGREIAWNIEQAFDFIPEQTFKGHDDRVYYFSFSPDVMANTYILSASADRTVRLWNIENGCCLKVFTGHHGTVYSVAFSNDCKYIISGSADRTVKLWDIFTGKCLNTYIGHKELIASVAFSPDGNYILSGSKDKTIKLWDRGSARCLRTFRSYVGHLTPHAVCFSLDGKYIISRCRNKMVSEWDMNTGECLNTIEAYTRNITGVVTSSDIKYLLTGALSNDFKLWDMSKIEKGALGKKKAPTFYCNKMRIK